MRKCEGGGVRQHTLINEVAVVAKRETEGAVTDVS